MKKRLWAWFTLFFCLFFNSLLFHNIKTSFSALILSDSMKCRMKFFKPEMINIISKKKKSMLLLLVGRIIFSKNVPSSILLLTLFLFLISFLSIFISKCNYNTHKIDFYTLKDYFTRESTISTRRVWFYTPSVVST
jgi:hypothetical protein